MRHENVLYFQAPALQIRTDDHTIRLDLDGEEGPELRFPCPVSQSDPIDCTFFRKVVS